MKRENLERVEESAAPKGGDEFMSVERESRKPPFSNELTDAELERLAILSEELGEAQQCIGKILRHGYESHNPVTNTGRTNRRELEQELGDVRYAISLLTIYRDVNEAGIRMRVGEKAVKIERYLHHQPRIPTIEEVTNAKK